MTFFWFVAHQIIAHPFLVTRSAWANQFHEWTAMKMGEHL